MVVAKGKKKRKMKKPTWVALGFDLSLSSIAGAGFAYDGALRRSVGPSTALKRWTREDDYFQRIEYLAKPETIVHELIGGLKVQPELDQVYIAIEEPWPFGMQKRLESSALKQQAQISGAFIGGLIRWGWTQVFEIHNQWWKGIVADELGITTHYTKYGKGTEGKMRSKEFCQKVFPDLPDWPDLISHNKLGLISRPEASKAKAIQPDDVYDSIPIACWMVDELERSGIATRASEDTPTWKDPRLTSKGCIHFR